MESPRTCTARLVSEKSPAAFRSNINVTGRYYTCVRQQWVGGGVYTVRRSVPVGPSDRNGFFFAFFYFFFFFAFFLRTVFGRNDSARKPLRRDPPRNRDKRIVAECSEIFLSNNAWKCIPQKKKKLTRSRRYGVERLKTSFPESTR